MNLPDSNSTVDEANNDTEDNYVKLFVGQIPKDMDEDVLLPFFSEFGPIADLTIIRDKTNQSHKGCAFLTYCMQQSAQQAVEQLHDKVKLPNATNPLQVRIAESQAERENKLFIGMLPKTIDEEDLHLMFASYGELREVHIIRGPEGSSKGCAFVKFVDRDAAHVAIEDMNEVIPPGSTRPLVVKFADSKKITKSSPGNVNATHSDQNVSSRPIASASKLSEYWMKQQLQLHQQSSMLYTYPIQGGALPQQQLLSVPMISYTSQGTVQGTTPQQQQQQFVYIPNAGYFPAAAVQSDAQQRLATTHYSQPQVFPQGVTRAHQRNSVGIPAQKKGKILTSQENPYPLEVVIRQDVFSDDVTSNDASSRVTSQRPPEGPSGANLFIYHLPRDLTDADLATLFAPFGNVVSAKVFVDKKTSDSKGFGFVSYDAVASADSAISAMNGFQIGSKRLKVQHKRTGADEERQYGQTHHQSKYGAYGNNEVGDGIFRGPGYQMNVGTSAVLQQDPTHQLHGQRHHLTHVVGDFHSAPVEDPDQY